MKGLSIRPLQTDESALLRALRMRALRNAPDAFAQTIGEIQDKPETYWQQLAKNLRLSHHEFFIAFLNEEPVGITYGHLEVADRHVAQVGSMWVSPTARGKGIGKRLLHRTLSWATAQGAQRMRLWVTADNSPATKLYKSSGFVPTGKTDLLPSHPDLHVIEMERELGP